MSNEFTVRPCEEKDREAFIRLNLAFMAEALEGNPYWATLKMPGEKELGETFGEALKRPEDIRIFVGELEGQVIGYANTWTVFSIWSRGRALTVDDLYVQKEYRRDGYGIRIMEYLSDFAEKEGYKRIQLHAEMDNERAHKLYRKLGYEEEEILFFMKKLNA